MTRVHHARPWNAPQRSGTLDQARAVHQKKKPYKIVLEAVTQEKKKLHSILTYASNAPTGFGFIPAGHPEFTEWCKEQCRQRNLDVHIVSAKPRNKMYTDPEKLSHHVHRVGHHFPIEIIGLACSKFGYTYDDTHGLKKAKNRDGTNWIAQSMEDYGSRQALHGRPSTDKETKDYIHGAVREMFPKIPEADLSSIVNHAFQKGTNRVGNAKELPLARRVQLAVVAHIRHTYTDYDKLLKTGGWMEARSKVEHVSLAKLKEWRDEAGGQSSELEETFREVIVLDDDDETSSDGESLSTPDEREQSMEIVSSRATARDLQPERYPDYPRIDGYDMRRAPRRTIVVQRYAPPPQPAYLPGTSQSHPDSRQALAPSRPFHTISRPPSRAEPFHLAHSRPVESRSGSSVSQPGPRAAPLMRDSDGRLYQLQPIEESYGGSRVEYQHPQHAAQRRPQEVRVQYPPPPTSFDRPTHSRRTSEQDVVLPSVERETVDITSPRRIADSLRPVRDLSRGYADVHSPKRKADPTSLIDRDVQSEQGAKRLRPVYHEDEIHRQPVPNYGGAISRDPHRRPVLQPLQPVIDLTSSPRQSLPGGDRGHFVPVRSYGATEPNGHPYVPVSSRPPPTREVRGAYYETPVVESSHAYMPEARMYERRAHPAHDYIPMRDEQQRPRVDPEGPRYLRSGVRYGGQ